MGIVKIKRLSDYTGYGVSADGRVWTKRKRGYGVGREYPHWHEKKQRLDTYTGYMTVWLAQKKGPVCVHTLMALAFLGDILPGYHVNHKDGNKTNNAVDNLEIITQLQNLQHAWKTGLIQVAKPKLTVDDVLEIRRLAAAKVPQAIIAKQFGLDPSGVSDIHLRKTWKHV